MIHSAALLLALLGGTPARPTAGGSAAAAFRVARELQLSYPHRLGAAEARRRVAARLASLQRQFAGTIGASGITWHGDDADVRVSAFGQVATAEVAVRDAAVDIRVHLPVLLSPLGGNIEAFLAQTAADTLR